MPRYRFQVRTETHVMLSVVVDCRTLTTPCWKSTRARLGDREWRMDVTDDVGLILFVLQISAMRSAATSRQPNLLSRWPAVRAQLAGLSRNARSIADVLAPLPPADRVADAEAARHRRYAFGRCERHS